MNMFFLKPKVKNKKEIKINNNKNFEKKLINSKK